MALLYKKQKVLKQKKNPPEIRWVICRHYLFSRAVASQVSLAQMSLTSVFGMGTGGPSSQSTPTAFVFRVQEIYYHTSFKNASLFFKKIEKIFKKQF